MGDGRLEDYPQMLITLQKDAEEKDHPYLIGGDEDFKASCSSIQVQGSSCIWNNFSKKTIHLAIGSGRSYCRHRLAYNRMKLLELHLIRIKIRSDKANNRYLHIDLDDQGSVPKKESLQNHL